MIYRAWTCSVYTLGLLGGDRGDLIPSRLTRSSGADTRGWGVKGARRARDIWEKSRKNKRNTRRRRKNRAKSRNKNIKLKAKTKKKRQGKGETGKKRHWKRKKKDKNKVKMMINKKRQGKRKNRKKKQVKRITEKKRLGNRKKKNKNHLKRMTKKKRLGKRKNRKKNQVKRMAVKKRQGNRKNKKKKQWKRKADKKRKTKRKNNSRRRGKRISRGRKQSGIEKNETGVFLNCLEQTVTIMRMWKDVITNFARQSKRIERQTDAGKSKSGKSGLFIPVAMRLREIGGGKMSELSCGGRNDTPGAEQLANLTRFLFDCEDNVKAVCQPQNSLNITAISSCKEKTKEFKSQAQKCVDKTIGNNKTGLFDACDCWTNDNLQEVAEAAKDCKFIKEANDVKNSLRNCTKAFSLCRKYEDEAVTSILVCQSQPEKLQQTVIPGHHQSRKK